MKNKNYTKQQLSDILKVAKVVTKNGTPRQIALNYASVGVIGTIKFTATQRKQLAKKLRGERWCDYQDER